MAGGSKLPTPPITIHNSRSMAAITAALSLLLLLTPALARGPHVITIAAPDLHPTSLAWDPTADHFLTGSRRRPSVSSVSDAGVVQTLLLSHPPTSPVSALALDDSRRRLLLALANPASLAAYDLRSPLPHTRIFTSPLASDPGGVAVDPATGDAFVTGSSLISKIDVTGRVTVLSDSSVYNGSIDGVSYNRKGFLLAVQGERLFKVDAEDGAAREVVAEVPGAAAVAVMRDGSAVVAGGGKVRMLKSQDAWAVAGVADESAVEEGWVVRGVAVPEGRKAYVLVVPAGEEESGARIEEVEWEREKEGDMVWGMVLLGLGFAYFCYWRFQMGKLAGSMNKKRA